MRPFRFPRENRACGLQDFRHLQQNDLAHQIPQRSEMTRCACHKQTYRVKGAVLPTQPLASVPAFWFEQAGSVEQADRVRQKSLYGQR